MEFVDSTSTDQVIILQDVDDECTAFITISSCISKDRLLLLLFVDCRRTTYVIVQIQKTENNNFHEIENR